MNTLLRKTFVFALLGSLLIVAIGGLPAMHAEDTGQSPLASPPKQDADDAREAEDSLDALLRRFGQEYAGLKARIDRAVDTGVDYLLSQVQPDGHFQVFDQGAGGYPMGGTALCALAIKKSIIGLYEGDEDDLEREIRRLERRGDRMDEEERGRLRYLQEHGAHDIAMRERCVPVVHGAIEWLRTRYSELKRASPDGRRTYGIGVTLMLLEAYYTERLETRDGYRLGVDQRRIPRGDLDWIREMVEWLDDNAVTPQFAGQTHEGEAWRYPGAAQDGSTVDSSNAQYAVLGLKAGSRMGVHMSTDTWLEVVRYYLTTQDADGPEVPREVVAEDPNTGEYHFPESHQDEETSDHARGWSYLPTRNEHYPTTSAMTTCGIAALVIAKSELYEFRILDRHRGLSDQIDRAVNDGLAWLNHCWSIPRNRSLQGSGHGWDFYYMYGLERAGIIAGTEFIGRHPWYPEGAQFLCNTQAQNGSWNSNSLPQHPSAGPNSNTMVDTSFAILFLKRATVPVDVPLQVPRPVITEGPGGR